MQNKFYVGIDPSLLGTGIIVLDKNAIIVEQKLISTSSSDSFEKRANDIWNELKFIPNIICLENVCIEGYSIRSKGNTFIQTVSLNAYIRIKLFENNVSFNIVPPKTLKVFIAGKGNGNCKKNLILKEVYKKWGVDFTDDNLADAYGLARYAMEKTKK
jgi:crossover junction endodeoxyribonuclease RuvC